MKGSSHSMFSEKVQYSLMLYPAVLILAVIGVAPIIGMFFLSFVDFSLIEGQGEAFGLHNYSRMLVDERFISSVVITLALTVFGLIFQLILGIYIAIGLDKIIPDWKFLRGIFVVPLVVPAVAVALIWLTLFTPTLSPINAFFEIFGVEVPSFLTTKSGAIFAIIVADSWASYPFVMLLILAALQGIPSVLDEAAAIDGATKIQMFFQITLPLLVPAILMITLFRVIEMFKHFPLIYIMTNGGPGRSTQATNYYAFIQTFQSTNVSYGASIAVFLFLFAAIISFYAAKANERVNDA